MSEFAPNAADLSRPRGAYGVDGDYRLIPPAVVAALYAVLCLASAAFAVGWLASGTTLAGVLAGVLALALIATGLSILRYSRRGKFEVWARVLTGLGLRGDERVLDIGCGRGAVLLAAAKLVPRGRAIGVDVWRPDQTGNSEAATWRNADLEGVADRIELHTRDMTDLEFADESFDLVVSSLAIHNLPGMGPRLAAVDEAVRVLRPGARIALADVAFTRAYAARLREHGLVDVRRASLGWRAWWGVPFIPTRLVTATKDRKSVV